jgi:hypothetical protein
MLVLSVARVTRVSCVAFCGVGFAELAELAELVSGRSASAFSRKQPLKDWTSFASGGF